MKTLCVTLLFSLVGASFVTAGMQAVGRFEIDRTETIIDAFRAFLQTTGAVTTADQRGGGFIYEGGWRRTRGWTYGPRRSASS